MPRHAWDRETISPKAREAPDEEQCRTQDRPRVSLGLMLVLGTQTWSGATSLSPGPAQLTPCPAPGQAVPGAGRRGHCPQIQFLADPCDHNLESLFFFELGKHTDVNNCDNPTPLPWLIFHTLTASPWPGKFRLFPPYPGLYTILRVGKIL